MKILLAILHADPARGGAERYTVDLARDLATLGHSIAIAARSFGAPMENVQFIPLDSGGFSRRARYRRFVIALQNHLRQHTYDIVHAMMPVLVCDLYQPHAGVEADFLNRGHAKHSSPISQAAAKFFSRINLKRRFVADIERQLLTRADAPAVICLSSYVREAVRRHYPLADDRLPIVLNGVDLARFDPAARPESRAQVRRQFSIADADIVALIIAQDFVRKGLAQAIEAIAQVDCPQLKLVVVGKPDPGPYRALASKLDIASRVIFAGRTDRPADFYRAADFFILPTRHDPCSLVVLEALAMGLPVISTRFNGACEAMTPGTHGFVLDDPSDIAAIATAVRRLTDPVALARSKSACMAVRPQLSQEHHVAAIVSLYEQVRTSRR